MDKILCATRSEFTDCCGASIIHDFFDADELNVMPSRKVIYLSSFKGRAYFAITSPTQTSSYSKMLEEAGFKAIGTFRNSNTRNLLTVWAKNLTTKRATPMKKKTIKPGDIAKTRLKKMRPKKKTTRETTEY